MKIDLEAHSKYFTMKEMIHSDTADKLGIDNTPTESACFNLRELMSFLDVVRQLWGNPINVNSGYRCEALNKAVGGAENSQHVRGQAADITVGDKKKNKELFQMIIDNKSLIKFDQLINENDYSWIHISHKFASEHNRQQVLFLNKKK